MNRKNSTYKKYIEKIGKCELCGSVKNLELHHILPLSLQPDGFSFECEENYICVCKKCHVLLTPTRLLTKIGLHKAMNPDAQKKDFYERLNEYDGHLDVFDVLDVYEEVYKNKNIKEQSE